MNPITLPIAELKPALTGLGKVLNRHTSLPVLGSVRIERNQEGWTGLTTTDLDRFLTVRLEQPTEGDPLTLLVPYEDLLRFTKNCSRDEHLQLELGPDNSIVLRFTLASQLGEAKVKSLPVTDFPTIPVISGEAVPLPESVRRSIREALECSSTDETRHILQGAFLDVSKPKAHYVVGTDGRHLYSSNSFSLPLRQSLVIPNHKFLCWKEFIMDGNWQIKLAGTPSDKGAPLLQLSSRRWTFITRQIEGNYPNWRAVVPDTRSGRTTIVLDPSTVEGLLQTVQRMPCHNIQHQTIGIECKDHEVFLLGKHEECDPWTRVPISATKVEGGDITVLCDRRYLAKALGFGLLTLDINDELSPLRFSHEGRQMIVMPVRYNPVAAAPATPEPPSPPPAVMAETAPPAATPDTPPPAKQSTSTLPPIPAINPPPPAEQPSEPKTMQTNQPANGRHHSDAASGSTTTTATAIADKQETKTALEAALLQVESIKSGYREAINGLTKLGDSIRNAMKEQKASEKEVHNVRQTLRSLQSVRI